MKYNEYFKGYPLSSIEATEMLIAHLYDVYFLTDDEIAIGDSGEPDFEFIAVNILCFYVEIRIYSDYIALIEDGEEIANCGFDDYKAMLRKMIFD